MIFRIEEGKKRREDRYYEGTRRIRSWRLRTIVRQNKVNHWNITLRRTDRIDDIQNWRGEKKKKKRRSIE